MTQPTVDLSNARDERREYFAAGAERARHLGNRGPIEFDADSGLTNSIREAYSRCGFYVFEDVLDQAELGELEAGLRALLDRQPHAVDAAVDRHGRPAFGTDLELPTFIMAPPLSDPVGGTTKNNGRHPARMTEYRPPDGAPPHVVFQIQGILQTMDACLRLYGLPQLLAAAASINGADFAPFADSIWIKEPGLGASAAWHQDGTTHWASPDLDENSHGFNFMAQLYPTTAENGLWVVPGTHRQGKLDIKSMVERNGSDRLPDAVPMLCKPGDVAICNRQVLHGSFANTSPDRRVTFVFGFHPRRSVLDVTRQQGNRQVHYDAERIHERSRVIALAIDARRQHRPDEQPYHYEPLAGEEDQNRWSEATRATILKNYNVRNLGI